MSQYNYLAGVDEVGRGPLAGPVVAAAVILPEQYELEGLCDSKKLSAKRREILSEQIKQQALAWKICRVESQQIDEMNILQASLYAMKLSVEGLTIKPDHVAVDGKFTPDISHSCEAIIKGDTKVDCISAAAILAKVERDAIMCDYEAQYPGYGFATHKGYPTKQHREALMSLGITPIHRLSYKPVQACLKTNAQATTVSTS